MRTGTGLVALAAVLWGFWPFWVRGGPGGAGVALVSYLVGGILGLPLALRDRRKRPARAYLLVALLGVVDATNALLYFEALSQGAVAPAVLSHYFAPVLVALTAPRLLGEPRSPRTPVAVLLALAGTGILVFSVPSEGSATRALLYGSGSAVFFAGTVLLSKKLSSEFDGASMNSFHLLAGAVYLVPFVLPLAPLERYLRPALGSLASTLVAGTAYFAGLRRIPAERAAVLGYLEPLVAVTVGWLLLGETPGWWACAGGALIVAGGALVVKR